VVDWHEFWTREYWHGYLGRLGGAIGYTVQALCVRIPQRAFCFSRLHRDRLRGAGLRGDATVLEGEYESDLTPPVPSPRPGEPVAVFAGRHIPEKRAPAVVPAIARARERIPSLRGCIFGDGPEYGDVLAAIVRERAEAFVEAPGFVESERVEAALRAALCMVLPSSREGYGLIVVEAAAHGCPSIVARGADNAAVELVDDGVNGVIAPSASADDLAEAIVRVWEGGDDLRRSTCEWFERNARRLSLGASLDTVVASYARARS
jgi:glycosyltransferase involved in cell wall biosynthesis